MRFAEGANLIFTSESWFSKPRVYGNYKGFEYLLHIITQSCGKNTTFFTSIVINFPRYVDVDLYLYQENFATKIKKVFGAQDIQIGDREFDEAFMIKSQTPEKIKQILTPELKQKILYRRHMINLSVSGNEINFTNRGIIKDVGTLTFISDLIWEMTKNICEIEGISAQEKQIPDLSYQAPSKSLPSYSPKTQENLWSNFTSPESDFTSIKSETESQTQRTRFGSSGTGEKICSSCNASVPENNRYCINCGRQM